MKVSKKAMQTCTKKCNQKLIHSNQIYFTLLFAGNTISETTGLVIMKSTEGNNQRADRAVVRRHIRLVSRNNLLGVPGLADV